MFSNGCDPCIGRARDWVDLLRVSKPTRALTVALVTGTPGGLVTDQLMGGVDLIVEGEQAAKIGRAMGVTTIPFAVRVVDGIVTDKSYVRYREHLISTFGLTGAELE